jgi:hypothetical protein
MDGLYAFKWRFRNTRNTATFGMLVSQAGNLHEADDKLYDKSSESSVQF